MVEASNARQGDDFGTSRGPRFGRSAFGGIADRGVNSLSVVVVDVLAEKTSQVVLAEYDDVVQKLSANGGSAVPFCQGL